MNNRIRSLGAALLDNMFIDVWMDGFRAGRNQPQAQPLSAAERVAFLRHVDNLFRSTTKSRDQAALEAVDRVLEARSEAGDRAKEERGE